MSPVPATIPTLAELQPVVQVTDPSHEPWLGCESVHPMTWVPGFAEAQGLHGDCSRTRRHSDVYAAQR